MEPVLIAGAGPVGLTMATELARYGVPVRIVDKAAQRTDKSKAIVVWSRTLELLNRGCDGAAPFLQAGFQVNAVNFIAGKKQIGHVSMKSVQSAYPFALMLPQSDTERLLEERLSGLGVTVERCVELAGFEPRDSGGGGVAVTLRSQDGREELVSASWLIGCDGAHSAVRHGLQVPFVGETLNSDWMLADVHVKGYPCPDTEVMIHWHQDGVLVIFPISPGRYRVLCDMPASGEVHPPTPTLDDVQAILERRGPGGMAAFDPIWLAGFRINGRKVESYRHGWIFLAGDAAHIHSPAGGQGMNTGMQDAFNLAWKLALVFHGTCDEALLDSYSPERSGVGDQVLKSAARLTMVGTLHNPVAQMVRNLVGQLMLGLRPVQQAFADNMTEMAIGYPESPLNGPSLRGTSPAPGHRLAPISGQAPAGAGTRPFFALFAEKTEAVNRLVAHYADLLDADIRPALNSGEICLVRPDGYVACTTDDADVIADYVDNVIKPATGNTAAKSA